MERARQDIHCARQGGSAQPRLSARSGLTAAEAVCRVWECGVSRPGPWHSPWPLLALRFSLLLRKQRSAEPWSLLALPPCPAAPRTPHAHMPKHGAHRASPMMPPIWGALGVGGHWRHQEQLPQRCGQPCATGRWEQCTRGPRGNSAGVRASWASPVPGGRQAACNPLGPQAACSPLPSFSHL